MIFTGYAFHSKGCRFWDPKKRDIILSRDAKFDESLFEIQDMSSPSSSQSQDPFPSLDLEPLYVQTSSSISTPIPPSLTPPSLVPPLSPSTSIPFPTKDPPRWVRSLLKDSGISLSDAQSSTSHVLCYQGSVNVALLSYVQDVFEPDSVEEALAHPQWGDGMQEELQSIESNNTWELVPRPSHRKVIGVKWIFKAKFRFDGSLDKYKACLVTKGYVQKEGVDYGDTFAPTMRYSFIRIVLALVSHYAWSIFQLDLKSFFLNGDLEEEVYVEQPHGYYVKGREDDVYLLKKALYGLKQALRAWFQKMDAFLLSLKFTNTHADNNLYVLMVDQDICILVLYVDDLLLTGSSMELIGWVESQLTSCFSMTDLGLLHYFLGFKIWQHETGIFLSQKKYATKLLEKYHLQRCASLTCPLDPNVKLSIDDETSLYDSTAYHQLIGSLLYMVNSRLNLAYVMSILSQFSMKPCCSHWLAAQRVLCYVHGTLSYGMNYCGGDELVGYLDAHWVGCV